MEYLRSIHTQYVLVPIDKAANNIAIVCKRFYIERTINELGMLDTPSETYKFSDIIYQPSTRRPSSCSE